MNMYESIKNNITESDLKESGSQTTSLDYVKELAGYLQDFIDGCEKRNMTELSLPYSHLAGDALAVAGDKGGWIDLNSDYSYDDDEVFNEYKPDGWTSEESNEEEIEDSETTKEEYNFREEFGSEQNTDAYESIKSLIKYFNQYIEVVKKERFYYQNEDINKLYKVLTKLYEVQDAMDEAWKLDECDKSDKKDEKIEEAEDIKSIEKQLATQKRLIKDYQYEMNGADYQEHIEKIKELEDKLAKLKEKLNSVEE